MKKIFFLPLLVLLFSITACKKDKLDVDVELRYDSANQAAPLLPEGTYEALVRFSPGFVGNESGNSLEYVKYFLDDEPLSASLKIYGEGASSSEPGELLYTTNLIGLEGFSSGWVTHDLSTAINLDGKDLWVGIRFRQDREMQVIGCDPGPGKKDGDWMYDEADGEFLPMKERTTDVNVNWNIRVGVNF